MARVERVSSRYGLDPIGGVWCRYSPRQVMILDRMADYGRAHDLHLEGELFHALKFKRRFSWVGIADGVQFWMEHGSDEQDSDEGSQPLAHHLSDVELQAELQAKYADRIKSIREGIRAGTINPSTPRLSP